MFYILVFGLFGFLCIFVLSFMLINRRKQEAAKLERETRTGQGHVHAPTVKGAPQRHAPAIKEPGASGGSFKHGGLGGRVKELFKRGSGEETWKAFEDLLLKADVGPTAAADLVARVHGSYGNGTNPAKVLRDEIEAVLGPDEPLQLPQDRLAVVMVVGVNGAGKTTTIGKLAKRLVHEGRQVCLAASDTYRAAAGEQLEIWAKRAGAQIVAQERGADPSAVAHDAVTSAIARDANVLIVDTAGRLHTKTPLMDELSKIKRVIGKAGADVAETLLVLDAQTGQNGIAQARAFTDAVEVTGVVLTKTDGSAKGGIVLAVREELGVPIRMVGTGEGPGDLHPFEAAAFAEHLLAD
jgi:fused signal recognition particle receptor